MWCSGHQGSQTKGSLQKHRDDFGLTVLPGGVGVHSSSTHNSLSEPFLCIPFKQRRRYSAKPANPSVSFNAATMLVFFFSFIGTFPVQVLPNQMLLRSNPAWESKANSSTGFWQRKQPQFEFRVTTTAHWAEKHLKLISTLRAQQDWLFLRAAYLTPLALRLWMSFPWNHSQRRLLTILCCFFLSCLQ